MVFDHVFNLQVLKYDSVVCICKYPGSLCAGSLFGRSWSSGVSVQPSVFVFSGCLIPSACEIGLSALSVASSRICQGFWDFWSLCRLIVWQVWWFQRLLQQRCYTLFFQHPVVLQRSTHTTEFLPVWSCRSWSSQRFLDAGRVLSRRSLRGEVCRLWSWTRIVGRWNCRTDSYPEIVGYPAFFTPFFTRPKKFRNAISGLRRISCATCECIARFRYFNCPACCV